MKDKATLPAVTGGFQIQVSDFEQGWRLADMISQSSLCPKSYVGKPGDCFTAMLMGAELGLNPIQSLQNIATINGKPSLYGDACLALVMQHPKFAGVEETIDEDTTRATCTLKRGDATVTRTFTKKAAEKAGLWGKAGPWQQYPARMLQMRARSWAIRDLFPDALAGLSVAEEARDAPYIDNDADSNENAQISAVLGATLPAPPETEIAPQEANAELVEEKPEAPETEEKPKKGGHQVVTYAEIRDDIEKSTDVDGLIGISQEIAGMHHLGKAQQKELKDAVNARHAAITEK